MMNTLNFLVRRSDDDDDEINSTMMTLLIVLLVLVVVGLGLIAALLVLRNIRNARKAAADDSLPTYEKRTSNHRRLTITATPFKNGRDSIYVFQEKQQLMANSSSPPPSPVPEIRITFPDEVDDSGKRQSGRVVVVRVGEHSVGLEPLREDDLPPYQREEDGRFDSLDLDRMGGLKEKDNKYYS
ncbi:hypothetical protein P154DRAFT_297772 [Amniculicola lignicola CBS 123094]|uniref:Uncharacterized protein n=1 Tax=Amniculicola lignicola CBS 123094 TaxID=1392246 RepID=A0A6A5WDM4_9PLEO|nr:hypothetical protein P154DRAFT_297772 [Amniculicola lignicola CBS 123094]